jgi:RluA family pseudouridine synthase
VSPLRVLAVTPRIAAIDKAPGIAVVPTRDGAPEDCLKARVQAQLGGTIWVVHRLDRDTSGVVLFARDAPAHRALSLAFERGEAKKRYLALVEGRLERALTIDAPISAGRKGKMRVSRQGEQGKASQTRFRALEVFAAATLVEAEPLTGRTHHIRVHLAHAGHPLLTDPLYGKPPPVQVGSFTLERMPLHAARLEIAFEGKPLVIESPQPADFAAAVAALRG